MTRELCKAACEYIDYGLTVYPLNEKNTPLLFKWNTSNAIRDHDRAQEVFLNDPKGKAHGVGIVCGAFRHYAGRRRPKERGRHDVSSPGIRSRL